MTACRLQQEEETKMQIIITPKELQKRDLWDEACTELDINPYALIEGLISENEELTLTEDEARNIGII